jgi:uncharacterized membrane protein YphA (DoxX/SURF4 family)
MEEENKNAYKPKKYRWIGTAIAVVVILLGWIFFYSGEQDYKALFAAYFEPYPDVITEEVKDESGELASEIRNAFRYYNTMIFRMLLLLLISCIGKQMKILPISIIPLASLPRVKQLKP